MTIRNLEYAVHPKSVAVLGASTRKGSVGYTVLCNLINGGFEGDIWPVNPKYDEIEGRRCYRTVADLPAAPELAVIATPAPTVPGLIAELGEKGCRAAVVITAGLTRANGLRQAMLDAAKPHLLRIFGPNTIGLIVPPAKLNASFGHLQPVAGGLALLSQSGAITASLIDWAVEEQIGFSHIVSLGDMADVDVGDYLDLLAGDANTSAILLYLETVTEPRKFMAAARAASRVKPVIAVKAGRHPAGAKAAFTHTGALSGSDNVMDAALRRAGILRVKSLSELFIAAETLSRFPRLERARVGIVTNGGGAGVLAVDRLMDLKAELAELAPETIERLEREMSSNWSRTNPVDIIGDAPPQRYAAAVSAVAEDPNTDVILVMNCPTGVASPAEAARAVAELSQKGMIAGKPVLTCWLGEATAREGRKVLQEAGIATFATPADAANAVAYLGGWARAQKELTRVPSMISGECERDMEKVRAIFRTVAAEGRTILTEPEAKAVLAAYSIPVPETVVVTTPEQVEQAATRLLSVSGKLAVKLMSKTITHKSDVGGVVLDIGSAAQAREAAQAILGRLAAVGKADAVDGFSVQPMITRKGAHELILGIGHDNIFGPTLLFGAGGTAVEVMKDTAIALPPIDSVLAGDLIDATRIGKLLVGYRDRPPADREGIIRSLNALSQLVVDFPCVVSVDINPLLADKDGVIALDARIVIDPATVEKTGPNPALAIRPYPDGWEKHEVLNDDRYFLRPIKPADVVLYPPFLEKVTEKDIRLRLLAPRKHFPQEMLVRLTQIDYEREMAFVALREETGELAGIVRLFCDPDKETAEYGILVRSDLQGRGIGWALLNHVIDYARTEGIKRIDGSIFAENTKMLTMAKDLGFSVRPSGTDRTVLQVSLTL